MWICNLVYAFWWRIATLSNNITHLGILCGNTLAWQHYISHNSLQAQKNEKYLDKASVAYNVHSLPFILLH